MTESVKEKKMYSLLTDQRIYAVLIIILTAIPFITPIAFPVKISPWTQAVYNLVQNAPAGSNIMIAVSFTAGGWGEAGYESKAFVAHCFKKNLKLLFIADPVCAEGVMMAERVINELRSTIITPLGKTYGVDWVNLGVVSGGPPVAAQMALDFHAVIKVDYFGNSLKELAITKNIQGVHDFYMIFEPMTGPGFPVKEYWSFVYNIPYVQGTQYLTIARDIGDWQSGLWAGFIPGQRGAAEYELLTGNFMDATKALGAINMSHIFALLVLAAGNIYYWTHRKRDIPGVK